MSSFGTAPHTMAGEFSAQSQPLSKAALRPGAHRRTSPMMLARVRPSLIAGEVEDLLWPSQFVDVATWAVVAFTVAMPTVRVYYIALSTSSLGAINGRAIYAVVALACYLPVQVWLVLSAVRRPFGWKQGLGLAAIAGVMFAMIPLVGVGWVGILYMLGALVLVGLRQPWSLVLYAALLLTPAPLTFALGHPEWAPYFTTGMLVFPVSVAVAIRLIRAARDLQEARLALAHQAVLRQRQQIDEEIGESLGTRLAAIADQCARTDEMAARDVARAAKELAALVDEARQTLAEARRVVTRYREVSFAAELNSLSTLLSAAGINARLELPTHLPDRIDERDRESLRREIARLLEMAAPSTPFTIAVTTQGDRLHVSMEKGRDAPTAVVAAR